MPTVAYLTNVFPSPVEPYVMDEIRQLRGRGITVVPCSARRASPAADKDLRAWSDEVLCLESLHFGLLCRAAYLCITRYKRWKDFCLRALFRKTPAKRRLRALLHTFIAIYYAAMLERHHIEHIHVHHGYFASWVAMVAAAVLNIPFAMTLHGSDLLIHAAYLDTKLRHCQFCVTISDFNRRHILKNYPGTDPAKIFVRRMGVDCEMSIPPPTKSGHSTFRMLTVGRLHPVKDHAFLINGCHLLKKRGLRFACSIAGDGPELLSLEKQICHLGLQQEVQLLGGLSHQQISDEYDEADLIVLTSRSEGIPLVLMEAMARSKIVLAPAITGIPELVEDGTTGFLYRPGSLDDFAARVELITSTRSGLTNMRRAARQRVLCDFNREKNIAAFCDLLISHLQVVPARVVPAESHPYENSVLQ